MAARRAPVDRIDVRRHNLSLILRLLADEGARSRAALAQTTGLTKATVSSLVAELIGRRLVREVGLEVDQRVGRPATLIEVDGTEVVSLGVEINVSHIGLLGIDLAGRSVYTRRRALTVGSTAVDQVLPVLVDELNAARAAIAAGGGQLVGVTIAVPGVADAARGLVTFAPNLEWRGVPLLALLGEAMGDLPPLAMSNEANLGALAEFRLGRHSVDRHGQPTSLVYVLAADGVGAGMVIDGNLVHGACGVAGEIGHTVVQPRGKVCSCGNRGCWETLIALRGLLHAALPEQAEEILADRTTSTEDKVAIVTAKARANDPGVLAGLRGYARWLGIGLANVINTANPHVIVLGGFLPEIAPWVLPAAMETVVHNALGDSARVCHVELTGLGVSPPLRGAAIHAGERVFDDPTTIDAR